MIEIIDTLDFYEEAKKTGNEIWLLNDLGDRDIPEDVINEMEITQSLLPNSEKTPKLFTYIVNAYNNNTPDYEVLSNRPESFSFQAWIVDKEAIFDHSDYLVRMNKIKEMEGVNNA